MAKIIRPGWTRAGGAALSVVIPAYNEERRLARSLPLILGYFRGLDHALEIVVVDDGSTDRTGEVARSVLAGENAQVLRNEANRGKGFSVRRGILAASAPWVLMTDTDLSTPIEEQERLARVAEADGADLVIGSRALEASSIEVEQGWARRTMGDAFRFLVRKATGLPFRDTQCGFKLLHREAVLPVVSRMRVDRFGFDVELLVLALHLGLRVVEVPVIWRDDRASKVNVLTDPAQMLFDVWRIRRRLLHAKGGAGKVPGHGFARPGRSGDAVEEGPMEVKRRMVAAREGPLARRS